MRGVSTLGLRKVFLISASICLSLTGCEIGELNLEEGERPDYILDSGYPPGCYNKGEKIVYEDREYDRKVFKETIVRENRENNRYTNVTNNYTVVQGIQSSPCGAHGPRPVTSVGGKPNRPNGLSAAGAASPHLPQPRGHPTAISNTSARPHAMPMQPARATPMPSYRPEPSQPGLSLHQSTHGGY